MYGEGGNDVVRGTHKVGGDQVLHGGKGHDKVYGGDAVEGLNYLSGNAGDDWVDGGDNFTGGQYLWGDEVGEDNLSLVSGEQYNGELDFYAATGDDVIYGGNYGSGD